MKQNFKELDTTKVGDIGETYIAEFATAKGMKHFIPGRDGSYPVDSICYHTGRKKHYAVEVKTKPRMLYFNRIGYDCNDHELYMNYEFPVYILFVDYFSKSIYGQWVKQLDAHKQKIATPTVPTYTFPLEVMTKYRDLTEEEIKELKDGCKSTYYK